METLTLTLTAEQCRTVRRALSHYASHLTRAAGTVEAEQKLAVDEWQAFTMETLADAHRERAAAADALWTVFAAVKG
jgi:hypothetical protein